jgi:REP element-mobilizing transposase RayT
MKAVLLGLLARAQALYPITICHYVFMANHVHMLIVVQDPINVPRFMEYFKRESAHLINRLLGRDRHTVWAAEYGSPVVLDAQKTMDRIIYFYTNPQRARLVRRIDDYPNLSGWTTFLNGGEESTVNYFPRTAVPRRASPEQIISEQTLSDILPYAAAQHTLKVEPNAWMPCFDASVRADPITIRKEIVERVRREERALDEADGVSVVGAEKLQSSSIDLTHVPKKRGKRMICLASEKLHRILFITWFKDGAVQAAAAVKSWLSGIRVSIPPGFFCPGGSLHSYINPAFTPFPLA